MKKCDGPLCNGKDLLIAEFSKYKSECKRCTSFKIKKNYEKNGRAYRNFKNEIKNKSICKECGCDNIKLLEFDHINKKNISICKSYSKKKIEEEVEYTQILCIWCHRLKSRKQFDSLIQEKNNYYNIITRPESQLNGKICIGPLCNGKLQYISQFYRENRGNVCKICLSYKSKILREKNNNFIKNVKLNIGECEICKIKVVEDTLCCFDFDHLKDKKINISDLAKQNKDTIEHIKEEIQKCRLLCCKCHKLITADKFKYIY